VIRQAHTYLVGALSGVTLIGIAIGVFILLVSAQVFHEFPLADAGGHTEKAGLSTAKAVTAPGDATAAAPGVTSSALTAGPRGGNATGKATTTGTTTGNQAASGANVRDGTGPAQAVESSGPATTGGESSSSAGGNSGSHTAPSPGPSSAPPGSSTGSTPTNSGTTSSSGGSTGSGGSGSGGSGTSGGSGGSGSTGGSESTGGNAPVPAAKKPAQELTETVNGTVGAVNEATGGTLEKTGVTEVTEGAVNGVVGPETVVGGTVDGVVEGLGNLVGGKSSGSTETGE
jgi:hypothetical protein